MNIEVFLTASEITSDDIRDRTVIVIDVFRTSTTIIEALSNGARGIVPAADMEEAGKVADNLDPASYLHGGERDGLAIEGYHLGNSPSEYDAETVADKTIVMCTTNGTGSICRVSDGHTVVIGGFVNAQSVVDFARREARDITIVCAGWKNRPSLEDTLCAGLFAYELWNGKCPNQAPDATYMAFSLFFRDRENISRPLRASNHAKRLKYLEKVEDIEACISINSNPLLPIYRDGLIVPFNEDQ